MRNILFVNRSMGTGGVERALLNQLYSLDPNEYKIDLLLFNPCGAYLSKLPPYVHVLHPNCLLKCVALTRAESQGHILHFLSRNFFAVCAKIFGSKILYKIILKTQKKLEKYDYAISYQNNIGDRSLYFGCNMFVLDRVIADKKIAWVHADYSGLGLSNEVSDEEYKKFDAVVQVSETMKKKFDSMNIIPKEKSYVVYNRIPIEQILHGANQDIKINRTDFTMVTVCRMDKLKSVYELCEVAQKLKKEKCQFVWYFLGNGPEFERCSKYIIENNLQENVILLGEVENPYPYMKNANLLVSGSVVETFGLTIVESLVIGTPVVAIRYEAICEIINNQNGVIVENFEELKYEIKKCITDTIYYENRKSKTKLLYDYNEVGRKQFVELLDVLK